MEFPNHWILFLQKKNKNKKNNELKHENFPDVSVVFPQRNTLNNGVYRGNLLLQSVLRILFAYIRLFIMQSSLWKLRETLAMLLPMLKKQTIQNPEHKYFFIQESPSFFVLE